MLRVDVAANAVLMHGAQRAAAVSTALESGGIPAPIDGYEEDSQHDQINTAATPAASELTQQELALLDGKTWAKRCVQ